MKKPMNTLIVILIAVVVAYLFLSHKPTHYSVDELKSWFSSRLIDIAAGLESDIDKDNKGEYRHAGLQTFDKRGEITYLLRDKNNARFEISEFHELKIQDILGTEGYQKLKDKAQLLNLSIHLKENQVLVKGVESFDEPEEHIDDYPRYFSVTISGW